jgi:hypothetical protein
MKTEKELNQDILNITLRIGEKFPELSKYLEEMPIKNIDASVFEINSKNLTDYYDSLDALLKNYATNHGGKTKRNFEKYFHKPKLKTYDNS